MSSSLVLSQASIRSQTSQFAFSTRSQGSVNSHPNPWFPFYSKPHYTHTLCPPHFPNHDFCTFLCPAMKSPFAMVFVKVAFVSLTQAGKRELQGRNGLHQISLWTNLLGTFPLLIDVGGPSTLWNAGDGPESIRAMGSRPIGSILPLSLFQFLPPVSP